MGDGQNKIILIINIIYIWILGKIGNPSLRHRKPSDPCPMERIIDPEEMDH